MIDLDDFAKFAVGLVVGALLFLGVWYVERGDARIALDVANSAVSIAARCDLAADKLNGTLGRIESDRDRAPWIEIQPTPAWSH